VYSPGAKPAQSSDVTCVGWNKKVQHIMASTSSNGSSVVWDLKLKRPVISFSDPNGRQRCSALVRPNPSDRARSVHAADVTDIVHFVV
jgi:protein transport protein SEC31